MTFNQLLLIFRAHLRVTLVTLFLVMLGALIASLFLPTVFKADATLVVDVRSPDTVLGNSGLPFMSPAYMNTQAELISSARVIEQAISTLKLEQNEEMKAKWEALELENKTFREWLTDFIRANLKVTPGKESNTLTVAVSSESPKFSADLANALAEAYITTSVALSVQPAKTYAQFFELQKQEARKELMEAQARLSDFQRERGIVIASDDQIDVENARLNELSSALTEIQTRRADQVGRASSAGEQGLLQDPISNVVLNNLRSQLQQKQSELAEASARIGVNHPEYQRLKAEVDALQTSVSQEIQRSNATLRAGARASISQESTVRKALEEQRERILKLTENRDSAKALQRDLDAAQKQFELVSARTSMSEISSRQATANAFMVSAASVPAAPSSPGPLVILLSAALFGLVLGLVISCAIEFFDHRVRSADDLAMVGLPVLARISTSTSQPRLTFNPRLTKP
jgi:polysaccharide biosynthesis transport protein